MLIFAEHWFVIILFNIWRSNFDATKDSKQATESVTSSMW